MTLPFNYANAEIYDNMYVTALKLIHVANRIDNQDELNMNKKSTILIFLPGIYEINCMVKQIENAASLL